MMLPSYTLRLLGCLPLAYLVASQPVSKPASLPTSTVTSSPTPSAASGKSSTWSAISTSSGTPLYVASSLPTHTAAAQISTSDLGSCRASMDGKLPANPPAGFKSSGNVRRYYIAAEQVSWNYAPSGWDNWLGVPVDESPRAFDAGYTTGAGSFGIEWQKAQYIGYTDANFTKKSSQPAWLGINGPIVRAEVGDLIEILFVNKLPGGHYADIHSMGLAYNKQNEGSLYPNKLGNGSVSTSQPGAAIPPGGCFTYKWLVGSASAPPPGEGPQATAFWSYHPFVNMAYDLNAGLVGPVIVYNSGQMATTMKSRREFVLLYENFDETGSWLAAENAARYGGNASVAGYDSKRPVLGAKNGNQSIFQPQQLNTPSVQLTQAQAPKFATLNGRILANMPSSTGIGDGFEMCAGDAVSWYVYAYGADSHTFHLHGDNFHISGQAPGSNSAVLNLNDGQMFALSMNTTMAPGVWGLICHVSDHEAEGMVDDYVVYPPQGQGCPLPQLG